MDDRFLAETIARKPQLFRAMLAFNRPGTTAVPEELSRLGEPVSLLWKDAAFRRAWPVKEAVVEGFWNFSEESRRIALLDAPTLRKLGLYFSAAAHAGELSRVIARRDVLELRQSIGADTLAYALKRGRYQMGSLRQMLLPPPSCGSLPHRIELLASTSFSLLCADWPEELRNLAADILPRPETLSPDFSPQLRREQRTALWFTMKKLLIREVAPEWAPCFD